MGIKRKAPHHGNTRRQWGSDHRDQPIPIVAPPISDRRIMIGRLAIVLTVSAWFTYVFLTIVQQFVEGDASSARLVIEAIVYIIVVTALTASAMAYLITRIGFFYRSRAHHRAARRDRSLLHAVGTDGHGARSFLPGGRAGHPHDAAVGRVAGAPAPACRAAHRRSAQPHDERSARC